MPRTPRFVPAGQLVNVCCRTVEGSYRLRPNSKTNSIISGALARATKEHGVRVHAVTVLSGHYHLLCSPPNAKALADCMQMAQRKISFELNRQHGRRGPLWEERYHLVPVTEEEAAQVEQLEYVLAQGCKEGLVRSPLDWPGVQSARTLLLGEKLEGEWFDRAGFHRARARKGGASVTAEDHTETFELKLEPLPTWAHLDATVYRARVAALVEKIEQETATMHRRNGTRPLGVRKVKARGPFARPKNLALSPKPLVHAASRRQREEFLAKYRAFQAAYREAATRLREGRLGAEFPAGSFPPALPFVEPC